MTAYKYKALSPSGAKVTGVVEAYDEFEAVAKIKTTCSVVLDIREVPQGKKERIDLNEPLWVSGKVLSITASQFAIMLRSGLSTARTVEVIARQTTDRLMRRILTQVAGDVSAGYGLARSLEARGKKIPMAFIETVRAGEESGTLEDSFARLAVYYEKSHKIRSKVRGAMMYPMFLAILAVIVIAVVITVALPVISGTIASSGGTLPLPTRILLAISNFFGEWWWLVLIVLVLVIAAAIFYGKTENGRLRYARIALKLPVLGNIGIMTAASQFSNTLCTLLTAGLPMTRALAITGKVIDNYAVGLSVSSAAVGIEEGKRLGEVLGKNEYLPPLLTEMAAVGEESGSLEDTLATIGAYYDSEVEQASTKALSMMEPLITVVLGVIIGFIVIALYMPMFTMYSGM